MRSVGKNVFKKLLSVMMCTGLFLQLVSCGTLLYPERRGQQSGRIDVAVVLMDGIGLFFFIIPGVVAFAVDLDTGAIYLPSSVRRSSKGAQEQKVTGPKGFRIVKIGSTRLTADTLTQIVTEQIGCPIRLNDAHLIVRKMDDRVDIARELIWLRSVYEAPCVSPIGIEG